MSLGNQDQLNIFLRGNLRQVQDDRFELAKDILLSRLHMGETNEADLVNFSISLADLLIAELKRRETLEDK